MNTLSVVLLCVSLALVAALVWVLVSFRTNVRRFRGRIADVRASGLRRRIHFGFGSRTLADIGTELNDLLDEMQAILEEKQRLELSHKRLIADISHDLRTPLTSLTGYLEVLQEGKLTAEERGEYLETVYRKARAMHRMTEELFELARLESGDETIELAPVELCGIVRETLAACEQDFIRAAVTPAIRLPDFPVTVTGNRAAVERIFGNLLSNALKYGSGGGTIGVTVREDGVRAYFSVSDRGKGIAEADLPNVFDRLYTADKARGAARGAGLGLAIAKQLAEKQNGGLTVRSVPGKETVFTLELPKAENRM